VIDVPGVPADDPVASNIVWIYDFVPISVAQSRFTRPVPPLTAPVTASCHAVDRLTPL